VSTKSKKDHGQAFDAIGGVKYVHLLGSSVVLGFIALPILWEQKSRDGGEGNNQDEEIEPPPSVRFVSLLFSQPIGALRL
jgi:hypothetical protein